MLRKFNLLRNRSFKRKLFSYSILICIVPVLLLGTASSIIASRMVQEEVNHNQQIILQQMQFQMDSLLQSLDRASIILANHTAVEKSVELGPTNKNIDYSLEMIDAIQKQRSFSNIEYDVSIVFTLYDKVYSSRDGFLNLTDYSYYGLIKNTQTNYSSAVAIPPHTYPGQDELLFMRPVPIFYTEEKKGMLILHVPNEKLTSFIQSVNLGERRKLYIVNEEGMIVLSKETDKIGTRLTLSEASSSTDSYSGPFTMGGIEYNVSAIKSSFNNWSYIAMTETGLLTDKAKRIQTMTWIVAAILTVAAAMISFVGAQRLYYPIQKLMNKLSGESRRSGGADDIEALDTFIQHMVKTNDQLKTEINEQLPYLKETVFQQLLRGEMSAREIIKTSERYGFPLQGSWFHVCLVDVDEYVLFQQNYRERDRSLMLYAIRKIAEETCEEREHLSCLTVTPLPGQVAVILGMEESDRHSIEAMDGIASELRTNLKRYFQFSVTVAVSRSYKGFAGISSAYQEALELLSYRLLMGHDRIISAWTIEPDIEQSRTTVVRWQKEIVASISQGNIEQAKAKLVEIAEVVPRYVQNSETVLGLFAYLIGELEFFIQEAGLSSEKVFPNEPYKQLYSMTSLSEVTEWFTETIFPAITAHLSGLQASKQKKTARRVVDYIHEHYDQNISLQHVADELGLSPYHISRAFKEETDTNFGEYLLHYRMDKAKEWLAYTDMPIKEISDRLCYTSVQNFTRIFKQITDMPPGKFRKQFRDLTQRE
ncbi:helix-turn-helix domain-containing protein [Paenibacillus sp. J2TS4]|uniref:helix-turn-helix domain-containing protein n=1 Tax=Paenibacillus sp. J2TS4 TaxID=2807194 RepID=UPI001B277F94|nr:helix-turn-helix domain-containing protein [Paenibacillus sp. J2TS4]GIP36140.1 hypothetical protein J2TS4_53500 [Paenibacillus sp. J2TS4]